VKNKSNPKALGLLAFVVLFLGGGATYFQYNAVQAVKADVTALESQVPSQKELEKSLADSHGKLAEYQLKLSHLEQSVPDVAYIPTLMKELEQIGLGKGIKVTGVRPAPAVVAPALPEEGSTKPKKKDYDEITIEVKGRGHYDNIKAFLDAIQEFPKVIAVKTISMTPMRDGTDGPAGDIELVVNVVAYVFPFELITASTVKPQTNVVEPEKTATTTNTATQRLAKSGGRK
jgi:Tfp pilus assembly protein PilO